MSGWRKTNTAWNNRTSSASVSGLSRGSTKQGRTRAAFLQVPYETAQGNTAEKPGVGLPSPQTEKLKADFQPGAPGCAFVRAGGEDLLAGAGSSFSDSASVTQFPLGTACASVGWGLQLESCWGPSDLHVSAVAIHTQCDLGTKLGWFILNVFHLGNWYLKVFLVKR